MLLFIQTLSLLLIVIHLYPVITPFVELDHSYSRIFPCGYDIYNLRVKATMVYVCMRIILCDYSISIKIPTPTNTLNTNPMLTVLNSYFIPSTIAQYNMISTIKHSCRV